MLTKTLTKELSKIVKEAGYDFWTRYNDCGAKTRRYKFMCNGYHHSPEQYKKWDGEIQKQMRASNIQFLKAGFKSCESFRGPYMAYVITVPRV